MTAKCKHTWKSKKDDVWLGRHGTGTISSDSANTTVLSFATLLPHNLQDTVSIEARRKLLHSREAASEQECAAFTDMDGGKSTFAVNLARQALRGRQRKHGFQC